MLFSLLSAETFEHCEQINSENVGQFMVSTDTLDTPVVKGLYWKRIVLWLIFVSEELCIIPLQRWAGVWAELKTVQITDWSNHENNIYHYETANRYTLRKVLFTLSHSHVLTHTHHYLVSMWLTGERDYAPPTLRAQPVLLCWILAMDGISWNSSIK